MSNEDHNLKKPKDHSSKPQKDIGNVPLSPPPSIPFEFQSNEQVFRNIRDTVSYSPVSQSKLQFDPQWILSRSIEKERDNYKQEEAYEEFDVREIPKGSNIISSHHFPGKKG